MLDLAAGSSLAGDLSNSGTLTLAGAGIGTATIIGSLTLNAGGTVSLNTLTDGSFDQLIVTGAVSVDGSLALGQQTTMPTGIVVLIDGGAALSGTFAEGITGLISGALISQAIAYDSPTGEVRLVTTVMAPEPIIDSAFPTGCTVLPETPLADGGTLTCISADTITETIATTVDGVTIIIGEDSTTTTVMTASGGALSATIAGDSAAGSISINTEFGIISGATDGIVATTAGSGSITITTADVTGMNGIGINARIFNSDAASDISITATGTISGAFGGIYARNAGTGASSISITAAAVTTGYGGIDARIENNAATGNISIIATGAAVSANNSGIYARQSGSGTVTIDASMVGATGGTSEGNAGIRVMSAGTGAISVMNAGSGGSAAREIRIMSSGAVSGAAGGIAATHTGDGAISITSSNSVTGNGGDAISANSAGGDISISGAHTVRGRRGIYADSDGGDISIQGAGATGGVTSTGTHGIQADARGGSGGNINIGGTTAIGDVSGATGINNFGVYARTDGTDSTVTIDTSGGEIISFSQSIRVLNSGAGASSISATAAGTATMNAPGIELRLDNSAATGDISVTTTGTIGSRYASTITAFITGSGTATITIASGSVSAYAGMGIVTQTVAGANIIVTAGSMISTSSAAAIQTSRPTGDSTSTPADTVDIRGTVMTGNILTVQGDDTVTLAAGSTTTGITINLGEDDDTLNLASTTFGTLDGGTGADTLNVSGTGINLGGGAHSNFETLVFTAGSHTLSGIHTGLASSRIDSGATLDLADESSLSGGLSNSGMLTVSGRFSLAGNLGNSGTLDLAAGSVFTGDLSNSGVLTVAGSSFGSATITGNLVLNAGGTLSLDTAGTGNDNDLLTVSGAVTLGGTLTLTQTTMPEGTVVLIDGASLIGTFAQGITGLINSPLISQAITYDSPTGEVRLVTSMQIIDSAFPTGCVVTPTSPLADGGTLTCISASPIAEAIATTVDGVTIVIGDSGTQTTVMTASGDALSASIAGTSAAGSITINTEFGIISGGANGIYAKTEGTGGISITAASVTGVNYGIYAGLDNPSATGDIMIDSSAGVVMGGMTGIFAYNNGTGGVSITTADVTDTNAGHGIDVNLTNSASSGAIMIDSSGGSVTGNLDGIRVSSSAGTGSITILSAAATGSTYSGITASLTNEAATGDISITATGVVMGGATGAARGGMAGIVADNAGTGGITIMSAAVAVTNAGHGISAYLDNMSASGDISITASGAVMGEEHGILAQQNGSGTLTIDASAAGAIGGSGEDNAGIRVMSAATGAISVMNAGSGGSGSRAISIASTGVVDGAAGGIAATHTGDGAVSITAVSVTGRRR